MPARDEASEPLDRESVLSRVQALIEARSNERGSLTLTRGTTPVQGLVTAALESHVHLLADAIETLVLAGLEHASLPLLRQAIECSVTGMWVALVPDGGDSILSADAFSNVTIAEAIRRDGTLAGDRAEELVRRAQRARESARETSAPRKFEQRCKELVGGEGLYLVYRLISRQCHADAGLVDQYLESIDTAPGVALRKDAPRQLGSMDEMLASLVSSLLVAGLAVDKIDRNHRRRNVLRAMARREGITTRFELTEQAKERLAKSNFVSVARSTSRGRKHRSAEQG